MGQKRKAETAGLQNGISNGKIRRVAAPAQSHIQIIAGSYDKVLHGIIATLPTKILKPEDETISKPKSAGKENVGESGKRASEEKSLEEDLEISFTDTFMMHAHSSAIRAVTISPLPSSSDAAQKVILATGANDERINLYNLSTVPPPDLSQSKKGPIAPQPPSLSGVKISQNALNKELGSLDHHNGPITRLVFPTRGKLLTAAEDNTISISRTRDWTVLSTIKAPIPKPIGRPSGDTFAPGEVPASVNDFAVHPSMKLMLSVGKGEKCMRLWNLVTGKKAGVLSFDRDVLQAAGEGKYGTGEGRRIVWDAEGEEFVVGFERGAVVYDIDCEIKSVIVPTPPSKIHQMQYVAGLEHNVLAISTEDGRILFFDTGATITSDANGDDGDKKSKESVPEAALIAQLGGRSLGVSSRIKDFAILSSNDGSSDVASGNSSLVVVTASSDGAIRLWSLSTEQLVMAQDTATASKVAQVGLTLASYETNNRITCLSAFVMNEKKASVDDAEDSEFGGFSEGPGDDESESDSESD